MIGRVCHPFWRPRFALLMTLSRPSIGTSARLGISHKISGDIQTLTDSMSNESAWPQPKVSLMVGDDPNIGGQAAQPASQTVDINYIKSRDFREVACDGVLGGPTPNSKLWLAFFTERLPLPRIVRYNITKSDGEDVYVIDPNNPGAPIETREGIIRNVEFGLYLSLETAEALQGWLTKNIEALKGEKK